MVSVDRNQRPFVIRCSPEGATAYLQKKLLSEGKEKGWANFLRWTQIAGILIASIIGLITFAMNIVKTDSNSTKIQQLESDVRLLKANYKIDRSSQ
ncbi:hypothetical protein GCM10027048_39740 [Hymenobacter coalescens]